MKLLITSCLHPPVNRPLSHSEINPILHGATNSAVWSHLREPRTFKLLLDCCYPAKQGRPEICGRPGQVNNLWPIKTFLILNLSV
jgi:hypothetical protein